MLKIDDVLEILSIPLLGIIPESEEVLRASNLGTPVTLEQSRRARRRAPISTRPAGSRRDRSTMTIPTEQERLLQQAVRTEGGMNLFNFFRPAGSAPVARERLQILLAHERKLGSQLDLIAVLREEILAVIARHVTVDRDKVAGHDRPRRQRLDARDRRRNAEFGRGADRGGIR